MFNLNVSGSFSPPCGVNRNCPTCDVDPCAEARRTHDAVRLIQAGARATLVCQLTDLPKKRVKRMYTLLQGHHSPQGQMPFTDTWYLENDLRMLHATLIWQLYQRITKQNRSEADIILTVYETYLCIVNKPELDFTRTSFVLRLVTMSLWQTRQCRHCHNTFLAPADEKHDAACPGCRLYHRCRCSECGTSLNANAMGRPRTNCPQCIGSKTLNSSRRH